MLTRTEIAVELADLQLRQGQPAEAIDRLSALVRSDDVSAAQPAVRAAVLADLGSALTRQGEYETSRNACADALHLAETAFPLARAYVVRALLCSSLTSMVMQRHDEAFEDATRARAVLEESGQPDELARRDVLDTLSLALREAGRYVEALDAYTQLAELDGRVGSTDIQADDWAGIGSVQRRMGRWEDAWASGRTGLALLPADGHAAARSDLLNNQGLVLLARKDAAGAIAQFEAALPLREVAAPRFIVAEAHSNLASALELAGRPAEAAAQLEPAAAIYSDLGPVRRPWLARALHRLGTLSVAAGDRVRGESALREAAALIGEVGGPDAEAEAASVDLQLADVLDDLARRGEADELRARSLALVVRRYGESSAVVARARLMQAAALRKSGRVADAESAEAMCELTADEAPDLRLACLTELAETELAGGRAPAGAAAAHRAVIEAEARFGRDGGATAGPVLLEARADAALGDAAAVARLCDRAAGLAGGDRVGRGWVADVKGRLLATAGDPSGSTDALAEALDAGRSAGRMDLVVSATGALAEAKIAAGGGADASRIWADVLARLSADDRRQRVAVLRGLGEAASSQARESEAARFFGEAAEAVRRSDGTGTEAFRDLSVRRALALARSGDGPGADAALAELGRDPAPAAALAHAGALAQLAEQANDTVAAMLHARRAVALAQSAFGDASVPAAHARLALAWITAGAGEQPEPIDDAVALIREQDPGWQGEVETERVAGLFAARAGRPGEAEAAFAKVEALLATHVGPASLAVAEAHADRAAALARGDAAAAGHMFTEALAVASPGGMWRNPVWARIASAAAAAAEQSGDPERARTLRRDAATLLPAPAPVAGRRL